MYVSSPNNIKFDIVAILCCLVTEVKVAVILLVLGELMACYTCHPEKHSTLSQNNDGVRYSNSEKEDKGVAGNTFQNSLKISQIKLKLSHILKVKITNMIKDTQILLLKTDAEIS